jgi:hypothetical protein
MWPKVAEMRWSCSPEAIAVGFLCFIVWVGLDGFYPRLDEVFDSNRASEPDGYWNPLAFFEASPSIAWLVIGVRILGSALIVPPLEEVFYRSTVYRYIIDPKIESVGLGAISRQGFSRDRLALWSGPSGMASRRYLRDRIPVVGAA